jgi:hypothetical protein
MLTLPEKAALCAETSERALQKLEELSELAA